ncbi:hypothetical protein EDC19_2133 [Natranaerovirga hydrolytica]|uniref:Uncharacterized protein n=1 Tax=Natranaerovirga hydrolytica TaxID=680378 RepID=A0A4R1MI82_9FIRM|nr:hypothetical protein [Natranaerovirga hydrolytica]TCK92398.1 hypothetical protein EDC19_2133 [Natranaerovirga hydrolytica]
MKLEFEEYLEEVKCEMAGYEEITEELIKKWEEKARQVIKNYKDKKNRIIKSNNSIYVEIEDEADIFKVADYYFAAIENDELDQYWEGFDIF